MKVKGNFLNVLPIILFSFALKGSHYFHFSECHFHECIDVFAICIAKEDIGFFCILFFLLYELYYIIWIK